MCFAQDWIESYVSSLPKMNTAAVIVESYASRKNPPPITSPRNPKPRTPPPLYSLTHITASSAGEHRSCG